MNPYLNWAILLVIAGGLAFYYRGGSSKIKMTLLQPSSLEKFDHFPSPTKKVKQRKPKKAPEPASKSPTPTPQAQAAAAPAARASLPEDKEDANTLEFAKQLSKIREGNAISTAPSKKAVPVPKPVSRPATGNSDAPASTSASSLTGAEADDDLSSIGSPEVKATGDVSDMLEAPLPGASILRLTGPMESEQKKNANKKSDGFKPAETKKQRQQRLKRENNKRMVEEAEAQRRVLLEKQLHMSRELERKEASKAKPPTSNAWKSGAPVNGTQKPAKAAVPLLDTFDHSNKPAVSKGKENKATPAAKSWTDELPSEEEQMRMLSAMSSESEWMTVSKKKDKRRANNPSAAASDISSSETPVVKSAAPAFPPPPAAAAAAPRPAPVQQKVTANIGHPLDSEWAA
ncbi:hypothetical protein LOZ65_006667 [Ophidiomyces ophidiicola]|nr:hypothetical protein LOZ65_006667 [Ophidiomyces ophidiicola]